MESFALAFRSANLLKVTLPGLLHDPVDRVVLAYPPLAEYDCYCLSYQVGRAPAGVAQFSCAESALTLAMVKHWEDKNLKRLESDRDELPVLLSRAANGLTVHQMIRRLQRLSMDKFPVCEYDAANDVFTLVHGVPRTDRWAVCFIPADPAHAFADHWTFTTVVAEESQDIPRPRDAYIIYSAMPIYDNDSVLWRARVSPATKNVYAQRTAEGNACDCDWRLHCRHEVAFVAAMGAIGKVVSSITLSGDRVVQGTDRAQVIGSIGKTCRMFKGEHGRVRVVMKNGTEVAEEHLHSSECLARVGSFQNFKALLRSDKSAVCRMDREVDIIPYRLAVWVYDDLNQCAEAVWYKTAASGVVSAASAVFGDPSTARYVAHVKVLERPMSWAADQDLTLALPRRDELMARLAMRGELDKNNVMDVVRRIAAEERWNVDVSRPEFVDWLNRTVTAVGKTSWPVMPPPGVCWNCLERRKPIYRNHCKECKRKAMGGRPEPIFGLDALVTYVGYRPLWSKEFRIPEVDLKPDVAIYDTHKRKYLRDGRGSARKPLGMEVPALVRCFKVHEGAQSCRGFLRGPMFLGLEPSCFPRGEGVAAQAFLVRLGVARLHKAEIGIFRLAFEYLLPRLCRIDPESWDHFISHFTGEKRAKNEEARKQICQGDCPALDEQTEQLELTMNGFPKAEKSNSEAPNGIGDFIVKDTEKPRFICSPNPIFLARIGPYTHAQTKWLAKKFHAKSRLYYAGCSTPTELNEWLNMTLAELPEPYTLVDDITAMDSNHSEESFQFHRWIRGIQFPYLSDWISAAYDAEEHIKVRVGRYRLIVDFVNASGVPDTSYKNSVMCLVIRLIAVACGYRDMSKMDMEEARNYLEEVARQIFTAASGDDGLTRLPDKVSGVHTSDFSMDRYNAAWARAGFSVKSAMLPPNRWRMATFLAMRPVWAGEQYEWASEPARRLKNMFWQFDNTMHPSAWSRGIASQVKIQSGHQYVLCKLTDWFLANTKGPVADVETIHQYSPFHGLRTTGGLNARSIAEFKIDYHVSDADMEVFENMLSGTKAVLVNFDCQLLRRVFAEES